MSDFRVEKVRQQIDIVLANGHRLPGTVFLELNARHHSGQQDPRELLNDAEAYFPVAIETGLLLVAKDQVKLVRYTIVPHASAVAPTTIDVRVILDDGSTLDGGIEVEVKSDAQRLLDYLNDFSGRFLTMFTNERGVHCLINRRMIVGVKQR